MLNRVKNSGGKFKIHLKTLKIHIIPGSKKTTLEVFRKGLHNFACEKNVTEMRLFNKNITQKGRLAILTYFFKNFHTAVLATLLIYSLPAFCSCNDDEHYYTEDVLEYAVQKENTSGDSLYLDIFFFNDDKLRLLDSYQRLPGLPSGRIEASSRKGDKIFFAISGDCIDPTGIGSYDDLGGVFAELVNENPENPVMTACTAIQAGKGSKTVTLEPLLSEIVVSSISCDFHRKPYSGQKLENVSIYLTNVRDRYPVTGEGTEGCSYINYGALSEDDMKKIGRPELISATLDRAVDETVVHPDIHFYCYPNEAEEESLGSPFTRLVIEGMLGGEKTYYPITINRGQDQEGEAHGIGRNKSYVYDITICRRGVPSPDIPIDVGILRCGLNVKEWNEKEERTIGF